MDLDAMTMRRAIAILASAASGCTEAPAALTRVEPPSGLNDRETPIAVQGVGLQAQFDRGERDLSFRSWTGEVGGRVLERVRWSSTARIDAVVPMGLPFGAHDVVLRSGERALRLPAGFNAVDPEAPRIDLTEPRVLPSHGGAVVIRGVGLHRGSTALLDKVDVPTTWVDDQTLRMEAPPHVPGAVWVEVLTPVGRVARGDLLSYENEM